MKTGKKIAIGCSGIVAIVILGIAGLFLLVSVKKDKYDKIAIPFFEEIIPVLSNWDYKEFEPYWAFEVTAEIVPTRMKQLFATYQRLGELESFGRPEFLQVTASTSNPYGSFVTYYIPADYKNGEATITCVLVPTKHDGLRVWRLQINSDAFLEPLEEPSEPGPTQ